jgi:localization factor PodJL
MHNLAVLYSDAQAGNPQYDLAAFWFRKAADHGLKDSQYNMAILCERGLGVAQNQEEAYFWYSLAAKQNDTDAAAKAQALEAALIPDALAKAKEKLAAWQATPPDRASNTVAIADPAWQISPDQSASAQIKAAIAKPADKALFGRELIKRAQELLASRGFDVGTTDGVMGSRTANAVRLFQLQKGLQVNGMVSSDLVRLLESES